MALGESEKLLRNGRGEGSTFANAGLTIRDGAREGSVGKNVFCFVFSKPLFLRGAFIHAHFFCGVVFPRNFLGNGVWRSGSADMRRLEIFLNFI